MQEPNDVLLDVHEAAAFLHLKPATLAKARVAGTGAPYYRVGRRILYRKTELISFLESRRRTSTSDASPLNPRASVRPEG